MKLDSFTTARCKQCGWIKQFQPGKEYSADDFVCNCKDKDEISQLDILKEKADKLGVTYASNIGEKSLAKKIKEFKDGES